MLIAIVRRQSASLALSCVTLSAIGCSGAAPSVAKGAEPPGSVSAARGAAEAAILPAGLCGFDPYLDGPCAGFATARFAVVLGERRVAYDYRPTKTEPARELEAVLGRSERQGLTLGYPFAVSYDDMLAADSRRGLAVIGALFADLRLAQAHVSARAPGAEIVALRAGEHGGMWQCRARGEAWCEARFTVVQSIVRTVAWSWRELEQVEGQLQQAAPNSLDALIEERQRMLQARTPRCTVEAGRLFIAQSGFGWPYAPVLCDSGEEAGILAQSTRINSVVTRANGVAKIHRIVAVECDTPRVEKRSFGLPAQDVELTPAGCGD